MHGNNLRQRHTATALMPLSALTAMAFPSYSKAQVSGVYKQDYRYSFDAVNGNLSSRQNYLRSLPESFTYDNLERLLTVSGPQNLTMTYTDNDNVSTFPEIVVKREDGIYGIRYTELIPVIHVYHFKTLYGKIDQKTLKYYSEHVAYSYTDFYYPSIEIPAYNNYNNLSIYNIPGYLIPIP